MTKAVLTVSLNATMDISYRVDGFIPNEINHVSHGTRVAGGKANNVARVLRSLGRSVIATGFAGGPTGTFIEEDLNRRGIQTVFVPIAGENRLCTTVFDPEGQTVTEVRERGPELTEADAERFVAHYVTLLPHVDMVVLAGSLPPGIPHDFYRRLAALAFQRAQVRTIVDASGAAFAEAVRATPYFVKPNREELEEWAGRPLPSISAVLQAAKELIASGPLVAGVSMGAEGLLLVSPQGSWWAVPPQVKAVNTVGAGDSLVAGFVHGLLQELGAADILRLAVGCGTASVLTHTVAEIEPAEVQALMERVRVERVG